VRFTLELGRALHRYGTPAHQLEDALIRVSARLGIEGRFFSTPTSIFASFGSPEDMRTCLIRVHPGELDLEKLTRLDSLMEAVVAGRCTAEEGGTRLVQILAAPAPHGARLLLLCHLLVAACWGRLLGGGPREMLVAGLASLCVGLFAVGEGRWPALGRVLTPLSALLASTLAVLGAHFFGPLSLQVATLSGLVVLLPGLTLTTAVTELATRNLMAGTSRLVGSGLVFLQLGFGVAVGGQLAQWLPPVQGMVPQPMLPPWTEGLALLVGTMSTGVLVQTRRRDVPWAVAASLFTFGAARLGAFLIGPQLGAFVGALALGTASNLLSRYRGGPAAVTLVPGILMLVPGSVGYRSVASLLARDTLTGVDTAFNMLMVAVALVAGLLVANAVAPSRRAL
jgi:uncharacterized membrane protein YjjP (DUF1212 family)